ncbi:transposase domain-containing protein [Streptomyces sp. NPDC002004]
MGELTRIVPFEMVDEVLAETKAVQQRVRLVRHGPPCICCWRGRCSPSWATGRSSTGCAPV